jgi:hypothetical protein
VEAVSPIASCANSIAESMLACEDVRVACTVRSIVLSTISTTLALAVFILILT